MCYIQIQGLDLMALNKPMTLAEQIQYDLRESNRRISPEELKELRELYPEWGDE